MLAGWRGLPHVLVVAVSGAAQSQAAFAVGILVGQLVGGEIPLQHGFVSVCRLSIVILVQVVGLVKVAFVVVAFVYLLEPVSVGVHLGQWIGIRVCIPVGDVDGVAGVETPGVRVVPASGHVDPAGG